MGSDESRKHKIVFRPREVERKNLQKNVKHNVVDDTFVTIRFNTQGGKELGFDIKKNKVADVVPGVQASKKGVQLNWRMGWINGHAVASEDQPQIFERIRKLKTKGKDVFIKFLKVTRLDSRPEEATLLRGFATKNRVTEKGYRPSLEGLTKID